ncbi:MAG TPA: tail fiber protein [Acidimicrobiales bacterium]|nr:tail fiber protein [Acidimicrobiales bacterium]
MASPYIAQIMIMPYVFPPRGWASCDGQLLSIAQNTALFSLIGTFYGGDGRTTFALPDLRGGRAPMMWGQGPGLSPRQIGERGGTATVTLTKDQLAKHPAGAAGQPHAVAISTTPANAKQPPSQLFAIGTVIGFYGPNTGATTELAPAAVSMTGGSVPHNNMQPYLPMQYCICLEGVYPTRS